MPSKAALWKIWLIILLEGFVTISVEIITIRQLIPEVGNSVVVTSIIIGIFLLVLAYGYQAGGRLEKEPYALLRRNFLIAAMVIGFGLSFLFIQYFFQTVHESLKIPLMWTLVIYLCLVMAPIVYFLGQTVPVVMHLFSAQLSAGAVGGKVLHLSTVGSFLGSVLTTLLLMNFLGVGWTVVVNCFLLFALILLLLPHEKIMAYIALLIGLAIVLLGVNRFAELGYLVATTPYANYAVIPHAKLSSGQTGTVLSVNNSMSSMINEQNKGLPYLERIKTILFHDLHVTNKDILVLGAGGFTLSAENVFNNRFTYVDIDPKIYGIVKAHFLSNIRGAFVAADARLYVQKYPNSYDVIVSDTYSNKFTIPSHLLTQEYFMAVKNALRHNGIAVFNIIASPLLNTRYAKRVDNTLRSVFSSCTANVRSYSVDEKANIIYVCQKNDEENDKMIYTDDINRASLDY